MFFANYMGAESEYLSALNWDQEQTLPGDHGIMIDGYRSILTSLAQGQDIHFNTIVKEIHYTAHQVTVKTSHATYNADAVICTIPLGVLKQNSIRFYPELSLEKQTAIGRLGMGIFNIIALEFPTHFCSNKYQTLFFSAIKPPAISFFVNFWHFNQRPILVGYFGGQNARQLEALTDQALLQQTLQNLKGFFGQGMPEPTQYFITRWSQHPFSLGSYSYIPPGASGEDYQKLAQPIANSLFFAGEATHSDYPATVHGAYLSGMREANRIISMQ